MTQNARQARTLLLTSHALVLIEIAAAPEDVRIRDIAIATGMTERRVMEIGQQLEERGFIETKRVGRRNVYTVNKNADNAAKLLEHVEDSEAKIKA